MIDKTIQIYEKLRKFTYRITIETGEIITFKFLPENYHHLVGFQHLTDKIALSNPIDSMDTFYRLLKRNLLNKDSILSSQMYPMIAERIEFFDQLLEIVSAGKGKIIIEYDPQKAAPSIIQAKFVLYKREGSQQEGNIVFFTLFIGYNEKKKQYYPVTYVVEHSTLYTKDQQLWDCEIETIERQKKKKTKQNTKHFKNKKRV